MTIHSIYKAYEEKCVFQEKKVISRSIYNKVLKTNFGHLKPFAKKTACRICEYSKEIMKKKILSEEMKETVKNRQDEHISKAIDAKNEFLKCIDFAKENEIEVATFELQHALEMPYKTDEESYEWNQLWCTNVCVFDELRGKSFMYIWDESIAERGPEQIASCLFRYIVNIVPKNTKKLILYSKANSLNRNLKVTLLLCQVFGFLQSSALEVIEQRFFVPGHDSNSCNRCFDKINTNRKTVNEIFFPDDWGKIIATSETKSPFNITKMTKTEFYSTNWLVPFIRKDNNPINAEDWNWSNIISITVNKNSNQSIDTNNSDGTSSKYTIMQNAQMFYSYADSNQISKLKYDGLQKILKHIPLEYHEFYTSLKYNENITKDFALIQEYDNGI